MDDVIQTKLDTFFARFKKQQYRKGEILIRADEAPSGIFYLQKGIVKTYMISRKGDEVVLNLFKPISFFPMSWAINNTENSYYYEAVTAVTLIKAPREEVVAFIKNNPDVMFNLLSRLYRGLDGVLTRMSYLMTGSAHSRLITELLISAKRFGEKQGNKVILEMSEKDLGTRAGLTRETISREMKILKEKGLITLNKNVLTIKDMHDLEKVLKEM